MRIEEFYSIQIKSLKRDDQDFAAEGLAALLDIKEIISSTQDSKECIEKISSIFEELCLMINTPFYFD